MVLLRHEEPADAGDESVLGTTIYLNYRPFTVVAEESTSRKLVKK